MRDDGLHLLLPVQGLYLTLGLTRQFFDLKVRLADPLLDPGLHRLNALYNTALDLIDIPAHSLQYPRSGLPQSGHNAGLLVLLLPVDLL